MYFTLFWVGVALFIGRNWGWREAHVTIAAECETNGGFFVGKKVFRCARIEDRSTEAWRH